ncbi:MAG TPA: sugar ABC transporter permease, partial [Candidatus Caccomorpha excrementavium]|nr:sugar ABC transporter permease [Candidatus Caccomorpha excrementavium]
MEKISEQMITQINYGFASAMSWIYFAIAIVIIGVSSFIISRRVYYYD